MLGWLMPASPTTNLQKKPGNLAGLFLKEGPGGCGRHQLKW
jgi:hypothetical protein